ncbi:MAG TPA: hypothetical protein VIH22_02925 [Cyclobacteriaceae bacterium]
MNSSIIDVKAESFPWQAQLLGALFIIGAIATVITIWWLAAILLLCGLLLVTGHSGTVFNRRERTYVEYNSYLFIRSGEVERYDRVEKIFVNAAQESQKMYTAHTLDSSTFHHTVYNAYLKFDNGKKIFLTSSRKKTALMNRLKRIAEFLETAVEDYSGARNVQ